MPALISGLCIMMVQGVFLLLPLPGWDASHHRLRPSLSPSILPLCLERSLLDIPG